MYPVVNATLVLRPQPKDFGFVSFLSRDSSLTLRMTTLLPLNVYY